MVCVLVLVLVWMLVLVAHHHMDLLYGLFVLPIFLVEEEEEAGGAQANPCSPRDLSPQTHNPASSPCCRKHQVKRSFPLRLLCLHQHVWLVVNL